MTNPPPRDVIHLHRKFDSEISMLCTRLFGPHSAPDARNRHARVYGG